MTLRLDKISFNHPSAAGVIDIRRNETQMVPVPEWQYDVSHTPEDSPVAYRCDTVPAEIVIKASFYRGDLLEDELEIQAIAPPNDVLGNVSAAKVKFRANGYSDFVPFTLRQSQIKARGVGVSTTDWAWQYRTSEKEQWTCFDQSLHRIYSILSAPTAPWDTELPWTEVLEHACRWASGVKKDPDLAASLITNEVYALGEHLVTYQTGASYANNKFNCTAFLELLRTGAGKRTVNCDDCATIVSTFANILGCGLFQSGMGLSFDTNPILLIGGSSWCATNFLYHAVAWHDPCLEKNMLFDACLKVDSDPQPDRDPQTAQQPVRILFGGLRDQQYQFRLAKANSGVCVPIPTDRKYGRRRREIGKGYLADQRIVDPKLERLLKDIYQFDEWTPVRSRSSGESRITFSAPDLLTKTNYFKNLFHTVEFARDEQFSTIVLALVKRPNGLSQELVAIDLFECRDATNGNDALLQVLSAFEQLIFKRLDGPILGDVALSDPARTVILFRRDTFVGVVRNAGRQKLPVVELALALDQLLLKTIRESED